MPRTTVDLVKIILPTNLSDEVIEIYIDDANLMVTDILGNDTTLSDGRKEMIERYLTAHMITVTQQRQLQKHEVEDASASYVGSFGKGLQGSTYGQALLDMDTTGKLKSSLGKQAISFTAIPDQLS